jgi:hypothetical protein
VPLVPTPRAAPAEFIGVHLPKLQAPLAHGFVGHDDPALGQKLFDIAKTEREAEIQPNSMADDFRRKAVASVIGGSGGCFHEAILTHCSATFQVDNIHRCKGKLSSGKNRTLLLVDRARRQLTHQEKSCKTDQMKACLYIMLKQQQHELLAQIPSLTIIWLTATFGELDNRWAI